MKAKLVISGISGKVVVNEGLPFYSKERMSFYSGEEPKREFYEAINIKELSATIPGGTIELEFSLEEAQAIPQLFKDMNSAIRSEIDTWGLFILEKADLISETITSYKEGKEFARQHKSEEETSPIAQHAAEQEIPVVDNGNGPEEVHVEITKEKIQGSVQTLLESIMKTVKGGGS